MANFKQRIIEYIHMFFRKLFFFLFFLTSLVQAQQTVPEGYVHYSTGHGLSHNWINGITQDSTGYLWITTASGVNRFNGSRFVDFRNTGDNQSIPMEEVGGLTWLNKNLLGIYSSGLYIINTSTGETKQLFIPYHEKQYQYKFNMIEGAVADEKGHLYVLSRSGFYHFDSSFKLLSRFDYYSEAQTPVEHFVFGRDLFHLDENRLLIVSIDGLYVYDKTTRKIKKMKAEDSPMLSEFLNYGDIDYIFLQYNKNSLLVLKSMSDTAYYINFPKKQKTASRFPFNPILKELLYRSKVYSFNDSVIYITGHTTGYFKININPQTGKMALNPHRYFPNLQCHAILEDKHHKLWVGTSKGLYRMDENRLNVQSSNMPVSLENANPNMYFSSIYIDHDKIYVGTRGNGNLLVYDKPGLQFSHIISFEEYRKRTGKSVNVYNITDLDNEKLVLATDGPPIMVNKKTGGLKPLLPPGWDEQNYWTSDVFTDYRGNVWIGAPWLYRYNKAEGFYTIPASEHQASQIKMPKVIKEDGQGNIWMAAHGLSRYNVSTRRFDMRVDSFPYINMPDRQVSTLVIDKKRNILWFDSKNNGLIAFDVNARTYRHFTKSDGLTDNNIAALL
ncbi:MAG TPA: two-component regulator propeller domain-containing protein, partial [Chitinophagaceae bacterium]